MTILLFLELLRLIKIRMNLDIIIPIDNVLSLPFLKSGYDIEMYMSGITCQTQAKKLTSISIAGS